MHGAHHAPHCLAKHEEQQRCEFGVVDSILGKQQGLWGPAYVLLLGVAAPRALPPSRLPYSASSGGALLSIRPPRHLQTRSALFVQRCLHAVHSQPPESYSIEFFQQMVLPFVTVHYVLHTLLTGWHCCSYSVCRAHSIHAGHSNLIAIHLCQYPHTVFTVKHCCYPRMLRLRDSIRSLKGAMRLQYAFLQSMSCHQCKMLCFAITVQLHSTADLSPKCSCARASWTH